MLSGEELQAGFFSPDVSHGLLLKPILCREGILTLGVHECHGLFSQCPSKVGCCSFQKEAQSTFEMRHCVCELVFPLKDSNSHLQQLFLSGEFSRVASSRCCAELCLVSLNLCRVTEMRECMWMMPLLSRMLWCVGTCFLARAICSCACDVW